MNIFKEVLKQISNQSHSGFYNNHGISHDNYYSDQNSESHQNYNSKMTGNLLFFIACIFSGIFFIIFGIYELLFRSPLSSWTISVWQSVMEASPQSLINLPSKIIGSESLMQKTVGDWLGFLPGSFGQILAIIFSPISAVIGLVFVFIAFGIRIGGKFLNRHSRSVIWVKMISWLTLGGSFIPLLFEYGI